MIRYAGVNLCLEDADGTFAGWMDRYFALDEMRLFGARPIATMSPTIGPRSVCCLSLGIPVVNYPPAPPLRINSLYWPTGATRWARCLCLATEEQMQSILEVVKGEDGDGYLPQQLVMAETDFRGEIAENGFSHDENGRVALSAEMYLLTPRPISCMQGDVARLWMLPLVDARYLWQQRSVQGYAPTQWDYEGVGGALHQLEDALLIDEGQLVRNPIEAGWGYPDPTELHRDYQNPAVLLDAVSRSLGRRFVRGIDKSTEVIDADTSEERLTENLAFSVPETADPGFVAYSELAGGDLQDEFFQAAVPELLRLVFREKDTGNLNVIEKYAVDYEQLKYNPSAVRTIFCAARDDFSATDGSDASQETQDLADAIATAEFAWCGRQYDRSFAGLKAWKPTGYCDAVEWTFGRRTVAGAIQAMTRVASLPLDVGIDVNLCQTDPQNEEACECDASGDDVLEGFLAEDLDPSTGNGSMPTTAKLLVASAAGAPWDDVPTANAKQRIAIIGDPTGGDFTLTYSGQTTAAIAYNASASAVVSALEALANIGAGNVTGAGGALPGSPVVIEFVADLAATDVSLMVANAAGLTGGDSPRITVTQTQRGKGSVIVTNRDDRLTGRGPVGDEKGDYCIVHKMPNGEWRIVWISCRPANEVQQVAITGSPTGGSFTLTIWGLTTGSIAYNASAATVQTALAAILGSGNVECTGGSLPGTAVLVEFKGTYANTNVPPMNATASLTGGSSPAVVISVDTGGCCN